MCNRLKSLIITLSLIHYRSSANDFCESDAAMYNHYRSIPNLSSRPNGSRVNVTVTEFHPFLIVSFNQKENTLLMDVYIMLTWVDERLALSRGLTGHQCSNKWLIDAEEVGVNLWRPKLNFRFSLEATINRLPFENEYIWADIHGTLFYQLKLRLKIPCHTNLDKFPMDKADCFVVFASNTYDNNKVALSWISTQNPVVFLKNRAIEEHSLASHRHMAIDMVYMSKNFTELMVHITFKRNYSWYILQAYVPSGLIVFVSWVHSTLRPQNALPRLQIGSAMLLAVVVLFFNIQQNAPRFGKVKALDIWLIGCISTLILSAAETAVVALCVRLGQDKKEKRKISNPSLVWHHTTTNSPTVKRDWGWIARRIDNIFIMFFPIAFLVFVISYWVYFLWEEFHIGKDQKK